MTTTVMTNGYKKIKFIEAKKPDLGRVARLLELCEKENQWANKGPLYKLLRERYSEHLGISSELALTPCANGGIALEAMSRILGMREGRPLRWVGSAFSFRNLGRGHFSDVLFLDIDDSGMLSLEALEELEPSSFDGLIVVNPFGIFKDFSKYIRYAKENDKALLIDNAAGLDTSIPEWPWQSFSLHHTKPYGVGEGGLALTPASVEEELYSLIDYGTAPQRREWWLNNGKISDISCAFLIDRLEQAPVWKPRYLEQAERITGVANRVGLTPIRPFGETAPATSWCYLSEHKLPINQLMTSSRVTFGKYYQPLADLPNTSALYESVLNIPTHPDMEEVDNYGLEKELANVIQKSRLSMRL